MNILIFILSFIIANSYCSSHNHLNFETALIVFAAANEKCITGSIDCAPKKDEKNQLVKIAIGKNGDKESNIYMMLFLNLDF